MGILVLFLILVGATTVFFPLKDPFFWVETYLYMLWAFLVAQSVKNLPAAPESRAQSLGQEDLLEEGKATHSVFFPG